MLEKKLSIVIPLYNVQSYIEKCICSLEQQDIGANEYEILVIDDGSPDDSAAIVERLQQKYSNIRLLHKSNGGLGSARNYGIKHAIGEYIMFVDSDDYIENNVFSIMFSELYEHNLDYLGYGIVEIRGKEYKNGFENIERPLNIISGLEYVKNYQISISACTHILKTEIYKKNNIYFNEEIIHEDYDFVLRMYQYCNRMKFIDLHVYNYVIKETGSITSTKTFEQFCYSLNSWKIMIESLNSYFFKLDDEYSYWAKRWINNFKYIALNYLLLYDLPIEKKKKIFLQFKSVGIFQIGSNSLTLKRKLRCIIYRNTWLYFLVMCLYKKKV